MDLTKLKELKSLFENYKKTCQVKPKTRYHNITKKDYVSISEIENSLDNVFIYGWSVEVIKYEQILNSIAVHLRVNYINPVTGEPDWTEGLGASPIQGHGGNLKANGVQLALPSAKAYALKNAATKFGKLFGRDVAREDEAESSPDVIDYDKRSELLDQAIKAWNKSDKSKTAMDKALIDTNRRGIGTQFKEYLRESNQ